MHDEVHRCADIVFHYLTRTRVKIRGSRGCRRSVRIIYVRRLVIVATVARLLSREKKIPRSSSSVDLPRAERAPTFFVPRKPSCRKPLSRMNKDEGSLHTIEHSSPRTNADDSDDSEQWDNAPITDDDEEYERGKDELSRKSPRYRRDGSHPTNPAYKPDSSQCRSSPTLSRDLELKQRISSSPDLPINTAYNSKSSQNQQRKTNSHEKTPKRGSVSKVKETRTTLIGKMCIPCIGIVIALSMSVMGWRVVSSTDNDTVKTGNNMGRPQRLDDFRHTLRSMKDKFPGQEFNTWMEIEAGIAAVVDKSALVSMFVLFSNETRLLRCFADDLGSASSGALLSENSLSLEPEDISDDYGDAIDRLRKEIQEKKAVVVHDLLQIDPRAIQAFHTMCDRQNPLVEGAVYIMTLVAQDYVAGQSPNKFVENQLTNRFIGKVPVDKLQALIARLTDGPIIPVTPILGRGGCPS